MANVPNIGAYNPMLMTDGGVLVQDADNNDWWKLTPDKFGNYATGTWTELPSTPGYGPLYYASAILPDGRFFSLGGEYNMGSPTIWQNLGEIYDPALNKWSILKAPTGWKNIGDMGSITLPNGKLMLADPFSSVCALFDPLTGNYTVPYGTGKLDANDEEGLTLLPDGTVLTVETTPFQAQIFNPVTQKWGNAMTTPVNIVGLGEEIGPQVLRYDGTVICFGGGNFNAVYNTKTKSWKTAPNFPTVGGQALCCADAPACLLTNGNVLVQTGPPNFGSPSVFLEWDGKAFTQVPATPNAAGEPSFVGSMLMLPSGEVMVTDFSNDIELYTSKGGPQAAWAPNITSSPIAITGGGSYKLAGTQLNGWSGSSAYGDDEQNFTNYPIIRITNNATGHVTYCKEFSPSTNAICTGPLVITTNFTVPVTAEQGASTIQVVTNGIPSTAVPIIVGPPIKAYNVQAFTGTTSGGALPNIFTVDRATFDVKSTSTSEGQVAAIEADFIVPTTLIQSLTVNATGYAQPGVTGMVFAYDWVAKTWVYLTPSTPIGSLSVTLAGPTTGSASRFIGPGGEVRALFRAILPTHISPSQFTLSADQIYIN